MRPTEPPTVVNPVWVAWAAGWPAMANLHLAFVLTPALGGSPLAEPVDVDDRGEVAELVVGGRVQGLHIDPSGTSLSPHSTHTW